MKKGAKYIHLPQLHNSSDLLHLCTHSIVIKKYSSMLCQTDHFQYFHPQSQSLPPLPLRHNVLVHPQPLHQLAVVCEYKCVVYADVCVCVRERARHTVHTYACKQKNYSCSMIY